MAGRKGKGILGQEEHRATESSPGKEEEVGRCEGKWAAFAGRAQGRFGHERVHSLTKTHLCARHCSTLLIFINSINPQNNPVSWYCYPILQRRKLRNAQVRSFPRGYSATTWWSQDLELRPPDSSALDYSVSNIISTQEAYSPVRYMG